MGCNCPPRQVRVTGELVSVEVGLDTGRITKPSQDRGTLTPKECFSWQLERRACLDCGRKLQNLKGEHPHRKATGSRSGGLTLWPPSCPTALTAARPRRHVCTLEFVRRKSQFVTFRRQRNFVVRFIIRSSSQKGAAVGHDFGAAPQPYV